VLPPFETVGEIKIPGLDLRFISVLNDSAKTGGFLIFRANNRHMYGAYDEWAENELRLQQYLAEFGDAIEWSETKG
jgi:hypothetical protein